MPEHKLLWENWCDRYFLALLDKTLNFSDTPPKPFHEMNETEVNTWLHSIDVEKINEQVRYKVKIPHVVEFCKNMQSTEKTDVIDLSLSIEDNSTLTGTASILEEFAAEFSIPSNKPNGYIEFDSHKKEFNLKAARERYSFMKSVQLHNIEMKEIEKQMSSTEKEIAQTMQFQDTDTDSNESDSDGSGDEAKSGHARSQKEDNEFNSLFLKLINQAQQIDDSTDESSLDRMVQKLSRESKKWKNVKDMYGRTIFHAAVEGKHYTLANILLSSGVNPNAKEGCGATPMSIAVLNSDPSMCKLLLENFGECEGGMYKSFPSPLEMAIAMDLNEITDLFKNHSQNLDSSIVNFIQNSNVALPASECSATVDETMADNSSVLKEFEYKRSQCRQFPTAVVGDVGTCKNNRSVKNTDNNAYGWCAGIPGDVHAKGYLCEAVFKAHGSGGFHKIVNTVMKRPKVTKEAFKKRKFQDQNLNRIKEGVRDGSQSYGMAAVKEFQASAFFPSDEELRKALQKFGRHNEILLERFKKWLDESAKIDESHQYHQQLFTLFGPLLELFVTAGKEGDGKLREIVWVLLLPIFAQLGFRNYWTEAFVHVVNFTALWPLAFREMIKHNSTVNLKGKSGHNVDLDEYVETYIVRPLKTYVTGKCDVCFFTITKAVFPLGGILRAKICLCEL